METRRGILFLCLVLGTFVFSADFSCLFGRQARAAGPTDVYLTTITEPTTWTKENSPYILHYKLTIKKKLTIEPGTVFKFASSATGIEMLAEISAVGTKKEKIVFTSIHDDSIGGNSDAGSERDPLRGDWDKINASPNYSAKFENVVVSYSSTGMFSQSLGAAYKNLEIRNSEIKNNITGIDISNLSPVIESNVISGNYTGISTNLSAFYPERTTTVRYNSFIGNSTGIFTSNTFALKPPTIDAKYNWWGSDTGPYNNLKNKGGLGDKVSDYWIAFDPWFKVDPNIGLDPVIIIPGIMGSWEVDGEWKIDPIFHTYDNLCEEFLANGYEDGKNFSVFPYEWRNSNVDNAKLLAKRIQDIKDATGRPKVDIVAHSMGGLLAREYIESDYFAGDVDQLITVGTPHLGAPKDYVTWEAGEFLGYLNPLFKYIFRQEAEESGYKNIFEYIHKRPMASVQELLPVYDYLYDENGTNFDLRSGYPTNYPRNEFLENLNNADKIKALKNVDFMKIVGKTNDGSSTEAGFNVIDDRISGFWEHGYPKHFSVPVFKRQGIIKGVGDGTVPLYSAEATNIPTNKTIYFQSEHNNLPTDAQQDILEILTGKRPDKKIDEWKIDDILIGLVFSPIDFQIVSPSGKRLGKNFETGGEYNEIPGAYYTGSDTETEFIVIPNPEDGEYQILTQGTGTGEYKIEIAKISQNDEKEAEESVATFTGTAEPDKEEELKIEIRKDEVKKVEKLTISEPEKKNIVADQIHTEIHTQIGTSSSNNISARDNQSKIQNLDFLKKDVRQYFKTNQIKNRKTAAKITKNLSHIRIYLKRYETETKLKKIKIAKTKANKDIEKLIRFINKNSPKYIVEETRVNLIEDLNDLRID